MIEKNFAIPFLEYEDFFVKEQNDDPGEYLKRAEPLAERAIFEFLNGKAEICLESTMHRPYAFDILKKLQQVADVRLIYVDAPLDTTIERLRQRPRGGNVEWSREEITSIYEQCKKVDLKYDLVLDNADASDDLLISRLRPLIEERVWRKDH